MCGITGFWHIPGHQPAERMERLAAAMATKIMATKIMAAEIIAAEIAHRGHRNRQYPLWDVLMLEAWRARWG